MFCCRLLRGSSWFDFSDEPVLVLVFDFCPCSNSWFLVCSRPRTANGRLPCRHRQLHAAGAREGPSADEPSTLPRRLNEHFKGCEGVGKRAHSHCAMINRWNAASVPTLIAIAMKQEPVFRAEKQRVARSRGIRCLSPIQTQACYPDHAQRPYRPYAQPTQHCWPDCS